MALQSLKLCRMGATDKDLADFFAVSEQTINSWKQKHPEFLESLKDGKVSSDAEVAHKLFLRATGFEWVEQHPIKCKTVTYDKGKRLKEVEEVVVVEVKRVVPPDPTSAIFWLKNRQPEHWREKQHLEHTGKDGGPILTKEQRDAAVQAALSADA
jgi:hypothetical protein